MPFRILTVCTGNICRSPQAEQLLRVRFETAHAADSTWDLPSISSAGTNALVGAPMPHQAADLAREYGGDPENHISRQLTSLLVEEADLILTMAKEHRSAVAKLSPRASRRTFTLREFARALSTGPERLAEISLADTPGSGDYRGWLALAVRGRGLHRSSHDDDNIIDPYLRSDRIYMDSIAQIASAIDEIVRITTRNPSITPCL